MQSKSGKRTMKFAVRAGVNAGITAMVYSLLYMANNSIDNYLNICVMTIAAVFITEVGWEKTWRAGASRCLIMGIGVAFGMLVVYLDNLLGNNEIAVCILLSISIVGMLTAERLTGMMDIQCKLGSVSMILTVFTFRGDFYANIGKSCYGYGLMFFISTVVTSVICLVVTYLWDAAHEPGA